MPWIQNSKKDQVTVDLEDGGDNVQGVVTQHERTSGDNHEVDGAVVVVENRTNGREAEDTTGRDGTYDVDVNAASGHTVFVHARWEDKSGLAHNVSGTVRL